MPLCGRRSSQDTVPLQFLCFFFWHSNLRILGQRRRRKSDPEGNAGLHGHRPSWQPKGRELDNNYQAGYIGSRTWNGGSNAEATNWLILRIGDWDLHSLNNTPPRRWRKITKGTPKLCCLRPMPANARELKLLPQQCHFPHPQPGTGSNRTNATVQANWRRIPPACTNRAECKNQPVELQYCSTLQTISELPMAFPKHKKCRLLSIP